MLADGIVKLVRALAKSAGMTPEDYAAIHALTRSLGTSLKGEAAIDWDDPQARQTFLRAIVADADRVLDLVRSACAHLASDDPERKSSSKPRRMPT